MVFQKKKVFHDDLVSSVYLYFNIFSCDDVVWCATIRLRPLYLSSSCLCLCQPRDLIDRPAGSEFRSLCRNNVEFNDCSCSTCMKAVEDGDRFSRPVRRHRSTGLQPCTQGNEHRSRENSPFQSVVTMHICSRETVSIDLI